MKLEEDKIINIEVPVRLVKSEGHFIITTTLDDNENILQYNLCSQGKTYEEALKMFWEQFKILNQFDQKRSRELDKYKFFQKGDWKQIGGTWFTILGIQVYFRVGKQNKGGWFIPFTKINISFNNYWKNK